MFGKVMSIPDKLIVHYFELTTDTDEAAIANIKKSLRTKTVNPRDVKIDLGRAIVEQYHGRAAADAAADQFQHVFRRGGTPKNMPTIELKGPRHLPLDLLVSHRLVTSRSEARRLVEQGGMRLDKKNVTSWQEPLDIKNGAVLEVGKHKFYKLVVIA
jgi:tyrosyl-tRNA synthetase